MSAYTRWQLGADDNDGIVSFESFDDTIKFEFERLLNNYKLRKPIKIISDILEFYKQNSDLQSRI
ncbi:hypothetical protein [Brenneria izbisi]|uniref:Uncharacterized protein n=1 Tax=Brenneria izbisi TaxID=2939450 RepID=A0AA41Y0A2_9GAMM|nr:hypothetical protein [Brenneria izbisi]MCV9880022.1 hypothetical protein [Brenneria izbisi]MCV9883411.1 hypothetical protein [Brenneria izbisi]